jgi:hypothetical protein
LLAERRHVDLAAERGGDVADRDLAGQVGAAPLEDRVRPDRDLDVQVAGRTAVAPRLALAAEPDPVAAVDAGRES